MDPYHLIRLFATYGGSRNSKIMTNKIIYLHFLKSLLISGYLCWLADTTTVPKVENDMPDHAFTFSIFFRLPT